jgi:hypothetical protein
MWRPGPSARRQRRRRLEFRAASRIRRDLINRSRSSRTTVLRGAAWGPPQHPYSVLLSLRLRTMFGRSLYACICTYCQDGRCGAIRRLAKFPDQDDGEFLTDHDFWRLRMRPWRR